MIIENQSTYGNSKSHEILAHAQTISNFFIDALEQNDCTLKVVVGFYFDVEDSMNTLEDITKATIINLDDLDKMKLDRGRAKDPDRVGRLEDVITSSPGVEAAVEALKERCFNCKLRLPKIKFEKDFRFTYEKLSLQIEVLKSIFDINMPKLVNYCHTSFALQKTCVPDILKLIGLLLTALSAILALNRLPKISLGVFVKAIIGKLMAAVVANIKLSIDMSQTGVPCVLSAIEEIARAVPTKEEIYNLPMSEKVRDGLFPKEPYTGLSGKVKQPFVPYSIFEQTQRERLNKKEITQAEYKKQLEDYRKANEPLRYYAAQLRSQTEMYMGEAESKVSDAFKIVSDIVTKAQDDVNSYIKTLLGIIEYFECENTRTGADFSDLISYINDLQTVINLFSAILGKWLTKMFEPLLCMDGISVNNIRDTLISQEPPPNLSNEDLADIIEEFLGTETKLGADGVSILIYDKPVKRLLPKLDLLGCNLKEFAEAHTIDNVIKAIVDDSVRNKDSNNRPDPYKQRGFDFPPIPTITRAAARPAIAVPVRNFYAPIKVTVPSQGRSPVQGIPFTILDRLRDRLKPTAGTKLRLPQFPATVLPFINTKLPINPVYQPDPLKTPSPKTPTQIKALVDKLKAVPGPNTDNPIAVIDLGPSTATVNRPDFRDELDKLLGLIYNPPDLNPQVNNSPNRVNPLVPDEDEDDVPLSEQGVIRRTTQARAASPSQKECQSFEDVLDILNTLRL